MFLCSIEQLQAFLYFLFSLINQYLINFCDSKSERLFFVKDSVDFFFDYGRRIQFELIESFMYGYFDLY